MKNVNISIQKELTSEHIDDLLVSCFEGGSNYWITRIKVKNGDYKGASYASHALSKGATIFVTLDEPIDEEGTEVFTLTRSAFIKGVKKYASEKQSFEFLDEHDGWVADSILQYALFDDIIFG